MSKLKYLVAIRHCEDTAKGLSDRGIQQANDLVQKIKAAAVLNGSVVVLTSPLKRGVITGEIIATGLGAGSVPVDSLQMDYYFHAKAQVEEIKSFFDQFEVVVVVTHFEAPSGVINEVSVLMGGTNFPMQEINKGNGFVLNCETKQVTQI